LSALSTSAAIFLSFICFVLAEAQGPVPSRAICLSVRHSSLPIRYTTTWERSLPSSALVSISFSPRQQKSDPHSIASRCIALEAFSIHPTLSFFLLSLFLSISRAQSFPGEKIVFLEERGEERKGRGFLLVLLSNTFLEIPWPSCWEEGLLPDHIYTTTIYQYICCTFTCTL
jgi:hypothetical protein